MNGIALLIMQEGWTRSGRRSCSVVLVVAAEHGGGRPAASPTCDKSDALDDYLQRVRDGTTGFEQE